VKEKKFAGQNITSKEKNRPLIIGKVSIFTSIKRYISHKNIDHTHM